MSLSKRLLAIAASDHQSKANEATMNTREIAALMSRRMPQPELEASIGPGD